MPNNKKQPFPEDKRINYPELVADECCDQLPIFSRVGRGLRGDSISAEYRYDPDTGYAFLDITTTDANGNQTTESFRVDAGCLHYAYKMFPDLGCFAITFTYDHPVDTMRWTWTTPLIPFFHNEGEFDYTGTMVKDVFTYPYGDSSEAVDQLIYPELTTREDWNAPGFGDEWTVDLSYGDPAADIPCPTFDQLNDYALKTYVDNAIKDPWPIVNGGTGVSAFANNYEDFDRDDDDVVFYDADSTTLKGISLEKLAILLENYLPSADFYSENIDLSQVSLPAYDPDNTGTFPTGTEVDGTITFSKYGRTCTISVRLELVFAADYSWPQYVRKVILPADQYPGMPSPGQLPDAPSFVIIGATQHVMSPMSTRNQKSELDINNFSVVDGLILDCNWWKELPTVGNSIWVGIDHTITFKASAPNDYHKYVIEGAVSYVQTDDVPANNMRSIPITIQEIPEYKMEAEHEEQR